MSAKSNYNLFWLPLLLFLFHFVLTGSLNRFATDDFEFLNKLRDHGFTGSVTFFYETWSVRWASIGLMNVFLILADSIDSLFVFGLFVLLIFFLFGVRLFKMGFNVSRKNAILLSGYLQMGLFYTCFNIGETFFWINSSVTYLVATACLMVIISEMIHPKLKWYSWMIIIVSAAYIGGSYEPMSFVVMCVSCLFIFMQFRTHGPAVAAKPAVIKSIVLLSILMIAFAISFAGEGHRIRSTFLPDTTTPYRLWAFIKAMIKITVLFGPWKLLITLVFCFPFYVMSANGYISLPFKISIFKATGALFALLALSYLPIVLVMSEMGPERAWMQVTFYLNLYAVFIAVKLGAWHKDFNISGFKRIRLYSFGLLTVLTAFAVINLRKDAEYAEAYDKRMEYLESIASSETVHPPLIMLTPLPEPGLLKSAEISEYSDGAFNHFLADHFQLKSKLQKAAE